MTHRWKAAALAALLIALAPAAARGGNPCPVQDVHSYSGIVPNNGNVKQAAALDFLAFAVVADTNLVACNGAPDPLWDGDYDVGVGGAFFGYGAWAEDPDCDYQLHAHGPNVRVRDAVYGKTLAFVVGEDDQGGPVKIYDSSSGRWACSTDGLISPCLPGGPCPDMNDPLRDPDDCMGPVFVDTGFTCGTGGGDGGYWVFFVGSNAPTSGTVTAF